MNCTADASASRSRWRATAALIRRLQQHADRADDHEREADHERGGLTTVFVAARVAGAAQQPAPGDRQHEDAKGQAHQLLIQPHVAVQDVAELVRDHALQLRAIEALECAARDRDRRVRGRHACGERVDAGLLLENVDLRHGQPRRQRHFFYDVHEPPLQWIGAFAADFGGAEQARDLAAAACDRRRAIQARETHDRERAADQHGYEPGMRANPLRPALVAEEQRIAVQVQAQPRAHDDGGSDGTRQECEQEQRHEHAARPSRLILAREEVHGLRQARAQLKETFGTARFSACSISRYSAALKPKLFAIRLPGKLWQELL